MYGYFGHRYDMGVRRMPMSACNGGACVTVESTFDDTRQIIAPMIFLSLPSTRAHMTSGLSHYIEGVWDEKWP